MKKTGFVILILIGVLVACTASQEARRRQGEATRAVGEAYMQQGNYPLALRELLKAEQLYADDPDLQNDLGFVYLQSGKLDLAVQHFKKALEVKPDFPAAKNNLGAAYLEKKEWNAAIACFKELTENLVYTTPQNPLVNLGWAYYNKQEYRLSEKNYNEALNLYYKGLSKDATYIKALHGISLTYMATGKYLNAVESLERAIKDAPRIAPLFFDLAEAYALLKEFNKAYNAYQKVIELAPGSDLSQKAQREAQKIDHLRK